MFKFTLQQHGVAEAASFAGHREILLDLFTKHVAPKPERKFESTSHRLFNPWADVDPPPDGDLPAKEPERISVEFSFLERLRQNKARKHRKRPITFATDSTNLGPQSPTSTPTPSVSQDQKSPKPDGKSDGVSSEKRKKITWP